MKRFLLLSCVTMVLMLAAMQVAAQDRTVSGRVTSAEDGSVLPGVSVVLKGTAIGTQTILSIFNHRSQVTFFELIDRLDRMGIIVTMLALLELMKNKFIAFHQDDNFEDVLLYKL